LHPYIGRQEKVNMPPVAGRRSNQEYWRSPNPDVMRMVSTMPAPSLCWHCGADYAAAAHFCHVCGSEREKPFTISDNLDDYVESKEAASLLDQLGLTVSSLIFFLLGMSCMVAALLTGILYKADTLVDWQAVQLWRIEWLLASSAALLAGILLKRHRS
jgi:hypothetical protein